jgi:PIN domain nuclease of toxin-antitoxin system
LKLLLDTHIWIWLLRDGSLIRRRTVQTIRDTNNELWLSPISTYEVLTLQYTERIRLQGDVAEWLARAVAGTHETPVTHEIALVARQLGLHQDPADRILVATAQVLDLVLVTSDEKLLGLPNIKSLANR